VTLEKGRGRYSKYAPYAFTELGVAMLSSVLNSARAIQMNIVIMRAFVRLREVLATHKALARKVEQLEATQQQHRSAIVAVVQEIKKTKAACSAAEAPLWLLHWTETILKGHSL